MSAEPILDVQGLRVAFHAHRSTLTALRDVSFALHPGRTLALVGESGSGKSVSSLAVMRLLAKNGSITGGRILYRRAGGFIDLARAEEAQMLTIRGAEISMIFQEPMSSLNPLFTVGDQIGEMLLLHSPEMSAAERQRRVLEMLELVEIPVAGTRIGQYPHEMSGGMRQRVMIALALICNPRLLIADEPTTALDVTIQAQILDLMRRLQKEMGMSILFITHAMGVVAEMADDVAVMYAGAIVERAPVAMIFDRPSHPYTQGLLRSIPTSGRPEGERLVPIPGSVPAFAAMPLGCAFAPRCGFTRAECAAPVALRRTAADHSVACVLAAERETADA